MIVSKKWATLSLLVLIVAGFLLPACVKEATADSYIVLVPRILRSGEPEAVSVLLFSGDKLATGNVELALLDGEREVFKTSQTVKGKGRIEYQMPALSKGEYTLKVSGDGFTDQAQVMVEPGAMIFLQTDKPIYKPGQSIHI